jgi:proteasome activator subunit 4
MFIIAVVQNIKIGDLSSTQSGLSFSSDAPGESMDVDEEIRLPDGTELGAPATLSKAEERTLVRESTAGFADWVTSLFRRVLSLYENLPEEGGRKNTTGGKQEESVIKSIKSLLDLVCLHLSDPLFDLVLKLVYDYVTANAKSNAVKAIGQMISSLALAHPSKTIDKFLPFCVSQIKDELKHGASSLRTTSSHVAIPSDTTLHWNMSILRGCFGHDGTALLKHKADIMELLSLLTDKTFSERGYSGTGRLIQRVLNTLVGVYPLNARFVNTDVWNSEDFDRDHNSVWGKLHRVEDVKIEWHVPSDEEISFILEILTRVVSPALDKVEALLPTASSWDGIARNDFCRHLHIVRSAWQGLPTLCKEPSKTVAEMGLNVNSEVERLVVQTIDVEAGFALIDPSDQRHQLAYSQRLRLGRVLHGAALTLKQEHKGEDHIDAVMSVVKGIDSYLLDYALSRGDFDNLQKSYASARELNRAWARQKENSRLVHLKRALVYHSGRVYMHALYRRRSELDNHVIKDLVDLSLSPYTRVRRHAQAVLGNVCGYYVRSTKLILPSVFDALAKGSDPDRMKGALYILWSKGLAVYAIADPKDPDLYGRYLLALLECQHQEKPSIQKLVTSVAHDAIANLAEETTRTDAYLENAPQSKMTVDALKAELSADLIDDDLLSEALHKSIVRSEAREKKYSQTISAIAEIALRPATHWRYTHLALQFLNGLLRRDVVPPSDVARLFISHTLSPHPPLRGTAQKGVIKLMNMIKMRTYSRTSNDLWLDEWRSPIAKYVPITSDPDFHAYLSRVPSIKDEAFYVDKQISGFLVWAPETKAYTPIPAGDPPITWESSSKSVFEAIGEVVAQPEYFEKLMALWGQESSRNVTSPELRTDNVAFIKTIAKMSQGAGFENILNSAVQLLWDTDRFKQRAGAEMLAGVTRGAKNWPKQHFDQLWSWIISRLDRIYTIIKPDTIGFWEATFTALLEGRDPRRVPALSDWILSLPVDFYGDSAFATIKSLTILGCFLDNVGYRDVPLLDRYFALLLGGTDVSFAEIRVSISANLYMIATRRWRPTYPSVDNFLRSVATTDDPLFIRRVHYLSHVEALANKLSDWKEERLPPPRVNQSTYDKVGLSLLRWLWVSFYSPQAPLMFPYMLPLLPEIFRMSELSDNPELQTHSQAVLYILSAVAPPLKSIEAIGDSFVRAISSSTSWRIRLNSLPTLVVFFYRNLMGISDTSVSKIMDLMLNCLSDDNVEVREMASSALSGIVRVSQRQSIIPLKDHFVSLARKVRLPTRQDPGYAESLRTLHSSILGLCALIESFPYSVEKWMPTVTDILALHATDPPPISTTIRKAASEFKKVRIRFFCVLCELSDNTLDWTDPSGHVAP